MAENNEKRPQGGGMGHGPGRGMGAGEKAKDFKGTIKKLVSYMANYKIAILFVMIFAAASTIFNIWGPKILSKAITELFNGLIKNTKEPVASTSIKSVKPYSLCWDLYLVASLFTGSCKGWIVSP